MLFCCFTGITACRLINYLHKRKQGLIDTIEIITTILAEYTWLYKFSIKISRTWNEIAHLYKLIIPTGKMFFACQQQSQHESSQCCGLVFTNSEWLCIPLLVKKNRTGVVATSIPTSVFSLVWRMLFQVGHVSHRLSEAAQNYVDITGEHRSWARWCKNKRIHLLSWWSQEFLLCRSWLLLRDSM